MPASSRSKHAIRRAAFPRIRKSKRSPTISCGPKGRCGMRSARRCCSPTFRATSSCSGTPTRACRASWSAAATPAPHPSPAREPGSNGLTFDLQGRLTLCQHGDRRISRREADGTMVPLATSFEGKRLNSPNDLVFDRQGALYFTDPPFGLPGTFTDPEQGTAIQCGVPGGAGRQDHGGGQGPGSTQRARLLARLQDAVRGQRARRRSRSGRRTP